MTRLDRIREWHHRYDSVTYYSGGGDNDHDGIPDRADVDDGNGVDCSGDVWASFAYAWAPDPPPFPLSSTSGYALMALHNGWFVPLSKVMPGDILLHSSNRGDIYHSDGPAGHTEIFDGVLPNGQWNCMGSASSGNGVGWHPRVPAFWHAAFRIPGLEDHSAPVVTPTDLIALARALEELDVEHGMAVDVTFNPSNPTQGYTLDRWGGIHPFGGAATVATDGYWPGNDMARRIVVTDWSNVSGYMMDLNGGLHKFGAAPRIQGAPYWKGGKPVQIDER